MGDTNQELADLIDGAKTAPPKTPTPKVQHSKSQQVKESGEESAPLYLTLVPKQARLRTDQLDALTSLARSLQRSRSEPGERITANTLIRVAVDQLLDQQDRLVGNSETEILESFQTTTLRTT